MSTKDLTRARTAHRETATTDWRTIVNTLSENLGVGLVALIADVTVETVSRWAQGKSSHPRESNERRLREAYRIYLELVEGDSYHTVRAWFLGSNPELGDESPAEALAHERFKETLAAARSFRDQ